MAVKTVDKILVGLVTQSYNSMMILHFVLHLQPMKVKLPSGKPLSVIFLDTEGKNNIYYAIKLSYKLLLRSSCHISNIFFL